MVKKVKKPLPILQNVEITDVAAEGKAIAKVDDMVVFVPFVVPGDVVDLQVVKKKKSFAEARAVKFHKYSTERRSVATTASAAVANGRFCHTRGSYTTSRSRCSTTCRESARWSYQKYRQS